MVWTWAEEEGECVDAGVRDGRQEASRKSRDGEREIYGCRERRHQLSRLERRGCWRLMEIYNLAEAREEERRRRDYLNGDGTVITCLCVDIKHKIHFSNVFLYIFKNAFIFLYCYFLRDAAEGNVVVFCTMTIALLLTAAIKEWTCYLVRLCSEKGRKL